MTSFTIPSITISGNNVSITTQSNGQINIASPGPAFDVPTFLLPSASFSISASMASDFYMLNPVLTTGSHVTILTASATSKQELSFWITDVDYPYAIINGGSSGSTLFTSNIGQPVKVNTKFDGTNWALDSFKNLALDSSPSIGQDPGLNGLGLLVDFDPTKFYSLGLTSNSVMTINNANPVCFGLTGSGHMPAWNANGWGTSIPSIVFTGSHTYTADATQYLINSDGTTNSVYSQLSCPGGSFSTWTIFIVFQLSDFSSVEQQIFQFTQLNKDPLIALVSHPTNLEIAVWNDSLGASTGTAFSTPDLHKHIIDMSADGSGNLNAWLDGTQVVTNEGDVHPKTIAQFQIGTSSPTLGDWTEQYNGQVARFLVFNQNLNSTQRNAVRNYLNTRYNVF